MTTAAASSSTGNASVLRYLYFVRFGFAIVWAALMFAVGSGVGPVSVTLIVLYPLFDVAAAIVDARSSGASGSARLLYVNIAISSLAAIGLIVALTSGIPAVLRVWGVWAVVAGIVQLVVALTRRKLGGQWAMIASGGISVLAGTSFFVQAAADGQTLGRVAGYAVLGGIFFLVSALRLGRAAKGN
ncbi:uncharacterized membrane protein HdeD (DUF308 family) [Pseudonocardia hierapolitana]|uniref:Uncharacterized membrane protein HdeD (DUF308 family) n=1 Tax=Pseudonocardia hierapolitana TaxID=1128676 RepID=A0A561SZY0_9PSEU|nr:hypothetical protein [Pseudonocardia hierapolitana]TWF80414.1 uncharacterized membrane protein HdeD (DUF308 family) [Pseudonocardia hierapolitana]